MAPGPVGISVVIPAYNEEGRLPATLAAIAAYMEARREPFEIIVADDGSRDGTARAIEAAAEQRPYLRSVRLPENRGKGRAVAAGVAASRGDLVLISDADLSTPIEELAKLEAALERGAGVAIGSRACRESRIEVPQPSHRVLMGKTFNRMVRLLLLPGLGDTQCGFKLLPGDHARRLFQGTLIDGFAFDVEVLHRARAAGLQIEEVPVRWRHSAPTRVAAVRSSAAMLWDLFRLWRAR